MKIQELRQMTEENLNKELRKARRELGTSRFRAKAGQNQNTAQITRLRKMIARIMTILMEIKLKLNIKTSK